MKTSRAVAVLAFCFSLLLFPGALSLPARVVINEIFYHAPDDIADLEYLELHNTANEPVNLGGWAFTKGIQYKFPPNARIEPKGYLVLCRNRELFKKFYDAPVFDVFAESLGNKRQKLELSDAGGKVVDSVRYQDDPPWPLGADGFSASLERITPETNGEKPANWAGSPLSEDRIKPAGTPGKANASFSQIFPPVISKLKINPDQPGPGESITVEAEVDDPVAPAEVNLLYRLAAPGVEKPETTIAMRKTAEHRYSATIPGQPADQLLRLRIAAKGMTGARRVFPGETEPRPAVSRYIHGPIEPGKIPFAWIIDTTEADLKSAQERVKNIGRGGFNPEEQARFMARIMVTSGLDLAGAWYELTGNDAADVSTVEKLKPTFAARIAERDKLIDDTVESSNVQEKMQRLPELIGRFQTNFGETLKPQLPPAQEKSFSQWQEKQSASRGPPMAMFGNPSMMIKTMINLEEAWYAVTAKADLEAGRLGELRKAFQELIKERTEIGAEAMAAMQRQEGFEKIGPRVEAFEETINTRLKPLLTAAQEKQIEEWRTARSMFGPRGRPSGRQAGRGKPELNRSAFVYFDPARGKVELFDFVQVSARQGGQKIHFLKDRPLNGMTSANLIFEYNDRFVLAEPLAYEVYRKAGLAAEQSYHVRLWSNGQPLGYFLLVEQPNRAFLREHKIRDDGNLYKILWAEQGVVRQHEKKTRTHEGHEDVVALVEALEKSQGAAQWEIIKKNFDVPQVATYFAVNTVLSHWDGFFNNYFTYHDIHGTGKWTMYPWDQDKTWGFHDGIRPGEVFYDMPLTFGSEGDAPPGQKNAPRGRGFFGGGGGAVWWRPGGFFSRPLLANPEFRKVYLARTREILDTIYREDVFDPVIDALGDRLREEVKVRAEIQKQPVDRALQRFAGDLRDLKTHLKKRREFLLAQSEIKEAAAAKK